MKTLAVSFVIWVFVVPVAVAVLLIFKFLISHVPDLYFASASLALAFSILTMVWGPFWLESFSSFSLWLFPRSRQDANSIQEKRHEKSLAGQLGF
jgi:hypothetical protein